MLKVMSSIALVLVTLGVASARSQQNKLPDSDAYAAVPADRREALKELVGEMTELQKQRQWSRIYDIMPASDKTESREDFVRKHVRASRLVDFDVDAVTRTPTNSSEWMVVGCAVFERAGRKKAWRSTMYASLSESQWLVSPVFIIVKEHGGFTPCRTRRGAGSP